MDTQEPYARLELSDEEMRALGYKVVDILVDHLEQMHEQPITRKASRPAMIGNDDTMREVEYLSKNNQRNGGFT